MFIATWIAAAQASEVGRCEPAIQEIVGALRQTMDAIRPGLMALIPALQPVEPRAYYATDEGIWYGVGMGGDPACALEDGTPVITRKGPSLPGYGAAETIGGEAVLVIGTHDPVRDGWDRIGWQAIVAHEWVHLYHDAQADPSFFYYHQDPLERRFSKDVALQRAIGALVGAARAQRPGCNSPDAMVAAWDGLAAQWKPRQQRDSSAWMFTEGMARYYEIAWENGARGGTADDLPAVRDPQCAGQVDDGEYAYPVGCGLALALDACLGADWVDSAWKMGFGPAIDRLR